MGKIIKNLTLVSNNYSGQIIEAGQIYSIPDSELINFQKNDLLISHLSDSTPKASIYSDADSNELSGSDAIKFLFDIKGSQINSPFTSKTIDGKKVFRRKHGITKDCPLGNTEFEFIVPYDAVKINELELTNCQVGDCVDLVVYDTPQGHIQQAMGVPAGSITPSLALNQFGFDVALPNGFFHDESSYDADLIKDMKIKVIYKNNGTDTIKNGVNIVYHELK